MNKISFVIYFLTFVSKVSALQDLETCAQNFVLETKRIEIPGHPYAFNPSIVHWRGSYLLCFRELPDDDSTTQLIPCSGYSRIALVFLDDNFSLDGAPQLLDLPTCTIQGVPHGRAEDARLINVDERLYIVYSDNLNEIVTEGGFRMFVGELDYNGQNFFLKSLESLISFPGESSKRREKNWVPFDYHGNLLLAYSIEPHRILHPLLGGSESCKMFDSTSSDVSWNWGELRGGTPALRMGSHYLAFFHSSMDMASMHSDGQTVPHYFIGAYTFSKDPPFALTHISPKPIIGKNFYHGLSYPYYWKPVQVVFPCGFVFDDRYIYLTYGRQDHEIWIATLDRVGFLSSLIPVSLK